MFLACLGLESLTHRLTIDCITAGSLTLNDVLVPPHRLTSDLSVYVAPDSHGSPGPYAVACQLTPPLQSPAGPTPATTATTTDLPCARTPTTMASGKHAPTSVHLSSRTSDFT